MTAWMSNRNLVLFCSLGSSLQKCLPSTRPVSPPLTRPWWINLSTATLGIFKRWATTFFDTNPVVRCSPLLLDTRSWRETSMLLSASLMSLISLRISIELKRGASLNTWYQAFRIAYGGYGNDKNVTRTPQCQRGRSYTTDEVIVGVLGLLHRSRSGPQRAAQ